MNEMVSSNILKVFYFFLFFFFYFLIIISVLKGDFLQMNNFFAICKILKCRASTILKLPFKRLLKWKTLLKSLFLINSFNFNKWIYIGKGRMGSFFQKYDKFSNLMSKSTASLHLFNVWRGIFWSRWKMTLWLRHESVTRKISKHGSFATSFCCDDG